MLQQDSVVVVDHTGIFGAVIDHYYPLAVAFLSSGFLKLVEHYSAKWNAISEPLKWLALYFLGVALTWLGPQLGFVGTVEGTSLTAAAVLAFIPTGVAGLIFKFGRHKVPPIPETPVMGGVHRTAV